MSVQGVPIEAAIDEHGIVRSLRADQETIETEFIDKTFAPDYATTPREVKKATRPDLANLRRRARQGGSTHAWRELGDAVVLWEGPARINDAINAYTQAIGDNPNDGALNLKSGRWTMQMAERRLPPTSCTTSVKMTAERVAF